MFARSTSCLRRPHHGLRWAALLGLLVWFPAGVEARDADQRPFAGMSGTWSGDGLVTMANGTRERMRCRASYSVAAMGASLNQGLRCASDSYRFDVKAFVQAAQDGALSGTWSEATHGVSGDVTGRVVSSGKIDTSVDTFGFSAALSVSTEGKRQHVSIVPQGNDVVSVSIDMQKI